MAVDEIRVMGHNMKGAGAGYGFARITEIGAQLEQAALRQEGDVIRVCVADLVRFLDTIRVEYD